MGKRDTLGKRSKMKVLLIKNKATRQEIEEMLGALQHYIKVAVDVKQGILAGGGVMHADCEAALLQAGSKQADVWGADWYPKDKRVEHDSLINIRPRQNNRSRVIQDQSICAMVDSIVRKFLDV